MKSFDEEGIVFYTGLESRKSVEIQSNPWAAATFVWIQLHRQVRFEGAVNAVDAAVADAYFATRPRGAQIAAHASRQSTLIDSRDELDRDSPLSRRSSPTVWWRRPEFWGGWRLSPDSCRVLAGPAESIS